MYYKSLFNINLFHAYFLDEGERKYFEKKGNNVRDKLSEFEKKQLEKEYDIANFLSIVPTKSTSLFMKNQKMLWRNHQKGINILASTKKVIAKEKGKEIARYEPVIPLSDTLTLSFYIKVHDLFFENYSQIIDRKQNQLYYLSNKSSSVTNIFDTTKEVEKWDAFLLATKETRKLLYELAKEEEFNINTLSNVSITEISEQELETIEKKIVKGTKLSLRENEILERLNAHIQLLKNTGVIGVLQLQVGVRKGKDLTEMVQVKNEINQQFDISKQCLLLESPEFKVCIENRKTYWRYNQHTKNFVTTTKEEKPLTKNGRVEIEKKDVTPEPKKDCYFPNPTVESIKKEQEKYYSEIFI